MLRIHKDGKPVSQKEQDKLVKEGHENVGRLFTPTQAALTRAEKEKRGRSAGLRPVGGDPKKEVKREPQKSK